MTRFIILPLNYTVLLLELSTLLVFAEFKTFAPKQSVMTAVVSLEGPAHTRCVWEAMLL